MTSSKLKSLDRAKKTGSNDTVMMPTRTNPHSISRTIAAVGEREAFLSRLI